ncbi:MAG: cation transporter [Chloroflexi bacterium]|nr:cation transporter [Chloroflexota bacterium]
MATSRLDRFFAFRYDLASRAAALSFTSNITLMVLKFAVGILTGSIAVLSDAIDSAEDAVASSFAFLSIRMASQPPDEEHPYGHGKAESVAAAGQALLIAGGGGFIIYTAVGRLIERDVEIDTTPGMIALAVTAVVNVFVVLYVSRAARLTGSPALAADTRHLWTNVGQAGAVFSALALVALTDSTIFDPLVALALAVYLLWTAAQVFRAALDEIMDVRLPRREEELIERCLDEQRGSGIRGYHDLRTRKSGRQRYVEFHLIVDPQQTVAVAHGLCDTLEEAIHERLPSATVTIHLEPDDGRYRGPWHEEHVQMGDGARGGDEGTNASP